MGQAPTVRFVLVHSPLVGPTTWRWVAEALGSAGHVVVVPDLRAAVSTGQPQSMIAAVVAAIGTGPTVLVGHSGAGFALPSVAHGLEPPPSIVFVDAGIPPCDGQLTAGADFLDQLRSLAVDGVLPRWSTWWGEGVMEVLVPNADRRTAIESEIPEVPLAFFESSIRVPIGWCDTPSAFLLLSSAYRQDADRAQSLGWSTVERSGGTSTS